MDELSSSLLVKTIRPYSAQERVKQDLIKTPIHTPYLFKNSQKLKESEVVAIQQTPILQQPQIQKPQTQIIDINCFDLNPRQRPNSAQVQLYKKKLYSDVQYNRRQTRQRTYDSIRYDLIDNNYVKYNSVYDNRVIDLDTDFTELAHSISEAKQTGKAFVLTQMNTINLYRGKKQTPDLADQLVINIKVYPPRQKKPVREEPYDINRLYENFIPYSKRKPDIERIVIGHKWHVRSRNLHDKLNDIQQAYQAFQTRRYKQQIKNHPMYSTKIFD